MKDLRQSLTENSMVLMRAAETVCADKVFVYDAIYLAVIRIKRKYKRVVNKDRIVELCAAEMRQPKKHVKQSFSSVEDCIEKALAAKILPWKPILSAAAVALAVAAIVPFYLPKEPPAVVTEGFVMNNTQTITNTIDKNGTYIKNIHVLPDLNGPDTTQLSGRDFEKDGSIYYDLHTTKGGDTYLACAYTDAYITSQGKASAEFILYRAEISGWIEIGRAPIASFTRTAELNTGLSTWFSIDTIRLMSDEKDNLYIVSLYEEGLQIHKYSRTSGLVLADQVKIANYKNFAMLSNTYTNDWCTKICTCYNAKTNSIEIAIDMDSEDESSEIPHSGKICFISYNIKKESFHEPLYYPESAVNAITADSKGDLYFLSLSNVENTENALDPHYNNQGYYLYRLNDGVITSLGLVTDATISCASQIPFFECLGDELHIVYNASTVKRSEYLILKNQQIVTAHTIIPSKSATSYVFIGFFLTDGELYAMELIDKKYLAYSLVTESGNDAIANFKLNEAFDPAPYMQLRNGASIRSAQNVVNLLMNDEENNTHLFQILIK